jgi:hypothetical protein
MLLRKNGLQSGGRCRPVSSGRKLVAECGTPRSRTSSPSLEDRWMAAVPEVTLLPSQQRCVAERQGSVSCTTSRVGRSPAASTTTREETTMRKTLLAVLATAAIGFTISTASAAPISGGAVGTSADTLNSVTQVQHWRWGSGGHWRWGSGGCRRVWRCGPWGCGWRRVCWE